MSQDLAVSYSFDGASRPVHFGVYWQSDQPLYTVIIGESNVKVEATNEMFRNVVYHSRNIHGARVVGTKFSCASLQCILIKIIQGGLDLSE